MCLVLVAIKRYFFFFFKCKFFNGFSSVSREGIGFASPSSPIPSLISTKLVRNILMLEIRG